jgi:Tat protein translocase TatB subunit
MGPLGWTEMVVIFFVALVVLGPKKLPELGKTIGNGLREYKRHSDDLKASWEEHIREVETPVQEIKQTFQEAQAEAEAEVEKVSAQIEEEEPPVSPPEAEEEEASTTGAEEKKHDAN